MTRPAALALCVVMVASCSDGASIDREALAAAAAQRTAIATFLTAAKGIEGEPALATVLIRESADRSGRSDIEVELEVIPGDDGADLPIRLGRGPDCEPTP